MEEAIDIEIDMDATIAEASSQRKGKKKTAQGKTREKKVHAAAEAFEILPDSTKDTSAENLPGDITVSLFDYSVENHFRAMDMISKLCGEVEFQFDPSEIQRLSSSITFLREWRHFNYQPRIIRFACQSESPQEKDVIGEINLPQFSSATVPKKDRQSGHTMLAESSKDFVMYVGGPVWALDWCPTFSHKPDCDVKSEFIAVAAHAPESLYHKIGAPLTGRGLIQIWCLLNFCVKEKNVPSQVKNMPKHPNQSTQPQKQRGRPRKTPVSEPVDNLDINSQHAKAAAVQFLDDSSEMVPNGGSSGDTNELFAKRYSVRKRKSSALVVYAEANQSSSDSETIEVKSPQPTKARGRPKKKPRDEAEDQYVQAIAVQSPKNSSSLTRKNEASGTINGQVAIRESGKNKKDSGQVVTAQLDQNPSGSETIEVKLLKPKKARGRPKKKTRDVLEDQYMRALVTQSSSLIPINEASGTNLEQVAKGESARKQKGSSQVITTEPKQNPSNNETEEVKSPQPKKTRGKPKKIPRDELENQYFQALDVQFPESMLPTNEVSGIIHERVAKKVTYGKKKGSRVGVTENSALTASMPRILRNSRRTANFYQNDLPLLTKDEINESSLLSLKVPSSCGEDPVGQLSENVTRNGPLERNPARSSTPKDVVLPRAVLCLAHNGKVAWDVKWRPSYSYDAKSKHRMGYLAVLLGNGALEVWEVPSPHAVRAIYSASQKEGMDPRFVKLDPVFRCSMLKCGDRQSMPLTVEWSASPPHDLILAGCHDGVVALWKFSANVSPKDTRPLLCFSADTVPIRALAWAPIQRLRFTGTGSYYVVSLHYYSMRSPIPGFVPFIWCLLFVFPGCYLRIKMET